LRALRNIYGFDINPIAIYISKINLLFLLKDCIPDFNLNLYVFDTLFQVGEKFKKKFDLVIGNPPWYTYRNIESPHYQEQIKNLAEELEIKPAPKNLLNLEISTIFFMKAKEAFLKVGGKIFYVITKGVITGSHASRFRNFKGFSQIKIWRFDKKVEKVFNIDFICLFGEKSKLPLKKYDKDIRSEYYTIEDIANPDEIKLEKTDLLIPYMVEEKAGKTYSKKLILKEYKNALLPMKKSYYKGLFHKGADLNPRNLIFVKYDEINESLVKINPDSRIFKKAKHPWNKKEYKNETLEKEYIFDVIKSTELVKFHVFDHYNVFLPLSNQDLKFDNNLKEYAKLFYDKINEIYLKKKKATTKHKNLMENLNRWSKLINQRQLSNIKVIYNNSGSILQSAVICGEFLITGDLTFYNTNNLPEAYYLSAILNSNLITQQIKIMKSSRHIFKLPLDIPIRKYDSKNPIHQKLSELGKLGSIEAKKQVDKYIERHEENYTKQKIQMLLKKKLKQIIIQIDEILVNEFHPN
jgi:hypothetical protein